MKPRTLAFLVSLSIAVVVYISCYFFVVGLLNSGYIALITFFIAFPVILFSVERFIAFRISLIYKLISNLKIDKDLKQALGNTIGDDPIKQIEKEVTEWAQSKTVEIETLKKNARYRKEFLGNLSHELKTPLFNIQGYVQSLIDAGAQDPEITERFLNKAQKNIDRLCALVADVDVISKLDSGEMPLNYSSFDLTSLVREVSMTLDEKARSRNIIIEMSTGERKMVYADKERITQVLSNLMDNSIKYGKEGGKTRIKFYELDKEILVEVTDDGIGISEEHLPRLFERFYRVDRSRKSSAGSGIGLAIVKHIIQAHQQTINVRSAINVGTTFAFTLQKA